MNATPGRLRFELRGRRIVTTFEGETVAELFLHPQRIAEMANDQPHNRTFWLAALAAVTR